MFLHERCIIACTPDPDDECTSCHTAAHMSADHEVQRPHHLLFPQIDDIGKDVSYAGVKCFIGVQGADQPFSAEMISRSLMRLVSQPARVLSQTSAFGRPEWRKVRRTPSANASRS